MLPEGCESARVGHRVFHLITGSQHSLYGLLKLRSCFGYMLWVLKLERNCSIRIHIEWDTVVGHAEHVYDRLLRHVSEAHLIKGVRV